MKEMFFHPPLFTALLLAVASTVGAQSGSLEFPQDPGAWINAPPISIKAIEGKAAVLYFFEES